MANNLAGPGQSFSAAVHADRIAERQAEAMREDADRQRAARAAGPARRSIAAVRRSRDDGDEF
ncbi:hypothetical protein [Actinoplanes sp. NPDC026619]|uniref:hypothetical protein n=1 Tax=Actinoplanes sp. NPDC026619 TaxID=3155798 RepID=UPI0033C30DC4